MRGSNSIKKIGSVLSIGFGSELPGSQCKKENKSVMQFFYSREKEATQLFKNRKPFSVLKVSEDIIITSLLQALGKGQKLKLRTSFEKNKSRGFSHIKQSLIIHSLSEISKGFRPISEWIVFGKTNTQYQ